MEEGHPLRRFTRRIIRGTKSARCSEQQALLRGSWNTSATIIVDEHEAVNTPRRSSLDILNFISARGKHGKILCTAHCREWQSAASRYCRNDLNPSGSHEAGLVEY